MKVDGNRIKALIGTIVIHALIVLALLFLALKTPLPLPKEQGVEVNLGVVNAGSGNRVNASTRAKPKPETAQKKETVATPPPAKKAPEKDMTQEVEKAPALPVKSPAKKKPVRVKKKPVPKPVKKNHEEKKSPKTKPSVKKTKKVENPEPVVNQQALFKLPDNKANAGRGVNEGNAEMGSPKGTEQGKHFKNKGGKGNGISYSLGGRGAKFLDKPTASFNEQGIVVVKIWVNPEGKVVSARVSPKGTTVVDENLRSLAVRSALNSTFMGDPSAPAQQIGTITYTFILKR